MLTIFYLYFIAFYLKPQSLGILLDTALFNNNKGDHVDSWAVLSEKTRGLQPSYQFTIENFDPVIDAVYPPEDLRGRKGSTLNVSSGGGGHNPSVSQVLAMKMNDDKDNKDKVTSNFFEAPAKQCKGRFSEFCKAHYEYICRKDSISNDGNKNRSGVSHYETHWAAMKAFVRGEDRKKRHLEHIMICRGSCGKIVKINHMFIFHVFIHLIIIIIIIIVSI